MKSEISEKTSIQELTAFVFDHLSKNGITAILTGGSVVTIYTENKYESKDLDFISPNDNQKILEVMRKIDFTPDPGSRKNLIHPHCKFSVEFPGRIIMLGGTLEKQEHEVELNGVKVKILSPTQSVMDRLAAYIAWKDVQCLDQAEWICEKHPIDLERVKKWAKNEGANRQQLNAICEYCERGMKKFAKKN